MAATYPSGIKAFPTYANGDQVTPTTINDPDLEITAIESGLIDGLAHNLLPDATGNHRSLGTLGQAWYDLHVSHDAVVAGTLQVTGGVTLTGAVTLESLTVSGDAEVAGNLKVDGDFQVLDKFSVSETTGTTSTGNLHVEGSLVATGQITATSLLLSLNSGSNPLFVLNNISPTGLGAIIQAAAGTDKTLELRNFTGTPIWFVEGNGTMTVGGATNVGGTLTVAGLTTLQGALGVATTLNVAGLTTLHGALSVANGVSLADTLTVNNAVTLGGTLDVRTAILSNLQPGVTVGASATTLYTAALVNGADVGGMVLVCGTRVGNAAIQFVDWVLLMTDGAATLISGHSKGAADSRVYSWSGLNFQLTMGANSYHVTALPTLVGTAGA